MANTFTLIGSSTLSSNAAGVDFTSIPNTYTDLILYASTRNVGFVEEWIQVGFNNNTTSYSDILMWCDEGTFRSAVPGDQPPFSGSLAQNGSASNTWSNNSVYIPNYQSSLGKSMTGHSYQVSTSQSRSYWGFHGNKWANTSAITTINIKTRQSPNAAILAGSTFYLYGIKNT
jgi:hypothetical protein